MMCGKVCGRTDEKRKGARPTGQAGWNAGDDARLAVTDGNLRHLPTVTWFVLWVAEVAPVAVLWSGLWRSVSAAKVE